MHSSTTDGVIAGVSFLLFLCPGLQLGIPLIHGDLGNWIHPLNSAPSTKSFSNTPLLQLHVGIFYPVPCSFCLLSSPAVRPLLGVRLNPLILATPRLHLSLRMEFQQFSAGVGNFFSYKGPDCKYLGLLQGHIWSLLHIFIFVCLQPCKNVKIILSSGVIQKKKKKAKGWIWPMGHSSPTPDLGQQTFRRCCCVLSMTVCVGNTRRYEAQAMSTGNALTGWRDIHQEAVA